MSGHSTALRDRSPRSCQNPMAAHVFKFKYKCLCSSDAYLLEISAPEVFVCWRTWPNRCFPASLPRTGLPPRACRVPAPPEQPRALPAGRGLYVLNRAPAALPAARRREPRGCARRRTAASERAARSADARGVLGPLPPSRGRARAISSAERSPRPGGGRPASPRRRGASGAAGAGGGARLCLLPLGAVPPPSAGRPAARGGREGGSAAERCCWKGSLKKVAGCPGAPAASWRSRASRRSTFSSPSRRPPPRPSAGPSAGTPTSCRRLSVSGAGGAATRPGRGGAAAGDAAAADSGPSGVPPPGAGARHCGGRARHCSGAAGGCRKLYPPGGAAPGGGGSF